MRAALLGLSGTLQVQRARSMIRRDKPMLPSLRRRILAAGAIERANRSSGPRRRQSRGWRCHRAERNGLTPASGCSLQVSCSVRSFGTRLASAL